MGKLVSDEEIEAIRTRWEPWFNSMLSHNESAMEHWHPRDVKRLLERIATDAILWANRRQGIAPGHLLDHTPSLDAIGAHTLWLRLDPTNQHPPEPLILTVRTVASRETLRLFHSGHVVRAGTEGLVTALYLTNLSGTKDGWELPSWCHQPTPDRWVAVLLENGFYTSVRVT